MIPGPQIHFEVYRKQRVSDGLGSFTETLTRVYSNDGVVGIVKSRDRAYAGSPALLGDLVLYCKPFEIKPSDVIQINNERYEIVGIENPGFMGHHLEIRLRRYELRR